MAIGRMAITFDAQLLMAQIEAIKRHIARHPERCAIMFDALGGDPSEYEEACGVIRVALKAEVLQQIFGRMA